MTITPGEDTYVTLAEALAYLEATRVAADPQLVAWKQLSDGDKEIYLRNATNSIERVRFPGRKRALDQDLAFPRDRQVAFPHRRQFDFDTFLDQYIIDYPGGEYQFASNIYIGSGEVPDNIKAAQIEEANELATPGADTKRYNATMRGVKAYRIGPLSETTDQVDPAAGGTASILKSIKAQQLVNLSAGGGFKIV